MCATTKHAGVRYTLAGQIGGSGSFVEEPSGAVDERAGVPAKRDAGKRSGAWRDELLLTRQFL
jgi:hypothetical protein